MLKSLRATMVSVLAVALLSAAPGDEGFKPVANSAALRTATDMALRGAYDWLAQKDLASLAQSGPELELMARLLAVQGNNADWQKATADLADAAKKLGPACRAKDATKATGLLKTYEDQLAALAKTPPGAVVATTNFKATASVKTWMLALDFAYNEAKLAKSADKMNALALVLAEEANAMQFARTDAKWRTISREVRDHALHAAEAAAGKKIDEAKGFLQKAFQRCEFCHKGK